MQKHGDVFSEIPSVTNVYEHKISSKMCRRFVRRTYIHQRVDREIQRVFENNIIERTENNFINPLVVVKKNNDD